MLIPLKDGAIKRYKKQFGSQAFQSKITYCGILTTSFTSFCGESFLPSSLANSSLLQKCVDIINADERNSAKMKNLNVFWSILPSNKFFTYNSIFVMLNAP